MYELSKTLINLSSSFLIFDSSIVCNHRSQKHAFCKRSGQKNGFGRFSSYFDSKKRKFQALTSQKMKDLYQKLNDSFGHFLYRFQHFIASIKISAKFLDFRLVNTYIPNLKDYLLPVLNFFCL